MSSAMQKHKAIAAAIAVALLTAVPLVSGAIDGKDAVQVKVQPAALRILRPAILASGELLHEEEVNLTSEVVGRVRAVHVEEGQRVRRDELLLAIDSEAYAAQVEQNRAAVRLEEIDADRMALRIDNLRRQDARNARLREQQLLDERAFEAARHELQTARIDLRSVAERLAQARARLNQSIEQLEKTRVRAPIDGVITALDIKVGETAIASATNIPGSRLMTIADPLKIVTVLYVDEADVADVRTGQKAKVVPIAFPNQPLDGVVEFVANTARQHKDRRGLSFLVRVRLADSRGIRLRPGMSCRAEIFTADEVQTLAVPVQAVVADGRPGGDAGKQFVYVARRGAAHKVEVQTGRSDDAWQEIVAGIEASQRVVTGPSRALKRLRDGDAIAVDAADAEAGAGEAA